MNQTIKTILTILLIFIASVFLAVVFAPIGGAVYSNITNARCGSGLFLLESFDNKCNIEGFIYFYILFITTFSFIFLKKKAAWILWAIGTLPCWALYILIITTETLKYQREIYIGSLILMLGFFAVGLGVSFIVNKIRNKGK